MSLLSGPFHALRSRVPVKGNPPNNTLIQEQLQQHAFRAPLSDHEQGRETWGWCSSYNLLDCDFANLNEFLHDRYLIFSLRRDRKRIPPALLKAHLEQRVKAWCQEHGRERCPGSVKAEIKENLVQQLMSRALTESKSWGVIWNVVDQVLYLEPGTEQVRDVFRKLFFETFGLRIVQERPLDMLTDELRGLALGEKPMDYADALDLTRLSPLKPAAPSEIIPDEETPTLPWFGCEFLLWLLCWSRENKSVLMEDLALEGWVDDRVLLADPDEGKGRVKVSSENPSESPVVVRALYAKKVIRELSFCLRREDREFTFSLRFDSLQPEHARLPQVVKGKDEEALYDRMFLVEELGGLIQNLVIRFAEQRLSTEKAWTYTFGGVIRDWIFQQGGIIDEVQDGEE